jgi:hypothetical protein
MNKKTIPILKVINQPKAVPEPNEIVPECVLISVDSAKNTK